MKTDWWRCKKIARVRVSNPIWLEISDQVSVQIWGSTKDQVWDQVNIRVQRRIDEN